MLKRNIAIILVLLVTLFIYFPSLSYHFVGDDYVPLAKIVTSGNLSQVFAFYYPSAQGVSCYFRPLSWLTYMLGYTMGGLPVPPDPAWRAGRFLIFYHILSLVFHLANVLLVYLIAVFIFGSAVSGALSALIFAVHPVNSEVVCWGSAVGDPAFTFFSFLSLILFARFYLSESKAQAAVYYLASLSSFMLALISKEAALCLPFLIILAAIFIHRTREIPIDKKKLLSWSGYFIIVALYFLLRRALLPQAISPWWEMIVKSPDKIFKLSYYLKDLVFPSDLAFLKNSLYRYHLMPLAIIAALICGGLFVYFIIRRARKSPLLAFSLLWVMIGLALPTLGIFAVARRHLYFPLLGYSIFLVALASFLKKRYLVIPILSLVIAFEIGTSLERNSLYKFSGEIVRDGLFELKKELPQISPGSYVYLVGLPGIIRNTPAFWAMTEQKIKFLYKDKNLPVFCLSTVTFTEKGVKESEVSFLDDFTFTQSMQTGLDEAIRVVGEDNQTAVSQWVMDKTAGYQFKILQKDTMGEVAKVIFKLDRQLLAAKLVYIIGFKDGRVKPLRVIKPKG